MGSPKTRVERAETEAARWHARLGEPAVGVDTVEEFFAWRADPGNAAAYQRVEAAWTGAGALAGRPAIDAALDAAMRRRPMRMRRGPALGLGFGLAAVGAAVAAAVGLGLWQDRAPVYGTATGEQRLVQLADGSEVRLDTASEIRVRFTPDGRRVELTRGQALFEVAHDPSRPFVVAAHGATVTALGTVFDVRRDADGVRVVLVSGAVEVKGGSGEPAWRLAAGQGARLARGATVVETADVERATGWTENRIVFRDTPLKAAVAEVNRYLEREVALDAPGLEGAAVNGTFRTGDRDAFVAAASAVFGLRPVPEPDGDVRLVRAEK